MSDNLEASELKDPDFEDSNFEASQPDLSGTIRLAESALASPDPPAGAEAASLSRMESLMRDATLSPRPLRESPAPLSPRPWWARLLFWQK